MRRFQVLNHFAIQRRAAEGFGERFPIVQTEAEGLKEVGLAVVVGMRGVEQVVREFLPLNQNFVCVWEFHFLRFEPRYLGCYSTFANVSASATALSIALLLFTVS